MAYDQRRSLSADYSVQDPRFDLFCKWLKSQDTANQSFKVRQQDTKMEVESEEFHDAEKEQSPPECVKQLDLVIPVIISEPPMNDSLEKDSTSITSECTESGTLIPDAVKLRRKLHSPKKGRAPEPPLSPINISNAPVSQVAAHVHKETII